MRELQAVQAVASRGGFSRGLDCWAGSAMLGFIWGMEGAPGGSVLSRQGCGLMLVRENPAGCLVGCGGGEAYGRLGSG